MDVHIVENSIIENASLEENVIVKIRNDSKLCFILFITYFFYEYFFIIILIEIAIKWNLKNHNDCTSSFFFLWWLFFMLCIKIFSHFINCSESVRDFVFDILIELCVSFIISFWFKNWIPSEVSASSWLNDLSWSSTNEKQWLFQLWAHISNNALSITCLIFKRLNHFG